ncbi:hypothetical protein SeLEV6574_g03850 [Synchytrium endobioticum]|uniref:Uncharacterized protein n=1 Tax=Synchytrium endobioticum TaxID=286115 RepID=A0A507D2J1_9FUNG|nr:hypothetical protein SeLEV6574_g03850 [Synchytrium endobioticum]
MEAASSYDSLEINEEKMQAIRTMIREYLLYDGFPDLLKNFEKELANRNITLPPLKRVNEAGLSTAQASFEKGHRAAFFDLWDELLCVEYKDSFEYLVARFWLEVYFAIYPALPSASTDKETVGTNRMEDFCRFLHGRGADVAEKSAEFASLYFLPYARNPSQHALYERFFQTSWVDQLKETITNIVLEHGKPPVPSIVGLIEVSRKFASSPPSLPNTAIQIPLHACPESSPTPSSTSTTSAAVRAPSHLPAAVDNISSTNHSEDESVGEPVSAASPSYKALTSSNTLAFNALRRYCQPGNYAREDMWTVHVLTDDDIRNHAGFDLWDFKDRSKFLSRFLISKTMTFCDFKKLVCRKLGLERRKVRFLMMSNRVNETIRPEVVAHSDDEVMHQFKQDYGHRLCFCLYLEQSGDNDVRSCPPGQFFLPRYNNGHDPAIVFLKYYDPIGSKLTFVGKLTIKSRQMKIREILPTLRLRAGLATNMNIDVFEEVDSEEINQLKPDQAFIDAEIGDGDILCYQKHSSLNTALALPT